VNEKEIIVEQFRKLLLKVNHDVISLPGLASDAHYSCLARQLLDSRRRIEFIFHIRNAKHHHSRSDPSSDLFDPLKAAVLQARAGNLEEAYWLVFIAVHFGKHATDGWSLARKIYGRLGADDLWNWASISKNPAKFKTWLHENAETLVSSRFSNHRKYESLNANSPKGTAAVFESYVNWIGSFGSHQNMIREIHKKVGQNPIEVFDTLYRAMSTVLRFGRLGRFDFLTMLGKLGLAPIEPGSAYLWHNATGPIKGARLLFGGAENAGITAKTLDSNLMLVDTVLTVGMQVLEDSLCNWQKNPTTYQHFKG
jgi:hypothetical protein